MVFRYIKLLKEYFDNSHHDYYVNLITPEYSKNSFGYSEEAYIKHSNIKNMRIIQIPNGSNGKENFGLFPNWKALTKNTAKFINSLDISKFNKVITIFNDVPFTGLASSLKKSKKHIKIWIPHSTIKIHNCDVNTKENSLEAFARLGLELEAVRYINKTNNCYVACISKFMKSHLIKEFGLFREKILMLVNGEIFENISNPRLSEENKKYFEIVKEFDTFILSFGRAEKYKNLVATMELGHAMSLPTVVIAQSYFKGQPIIREYREIAKETNSILIVDPPFNLAKEIISNFKNRLIVLIPSKKESMGLIINEVRKMNKNNVLLVSNKTDGLKEQIRHGYDGLLVNLDNIQESAKQIESFLDGDKVALLNKNSQKTMHIKYDFTKNFKKFIGRVISYE